jgi:DTW domain-containing protein YfiP
VQSSVIATPTREFCVRCLRAKSVCLCHLIVPFSTEVHFVFLMHRKELRDRCGTGTARMTHLCLSNSSLFVGVDFSRDPNVAAILSDPDRRCWVLFPDQAAVNLSDRRSRQEFFSENGNKQPVIFVLDGSWSCARALLRLNPRIAALPKVSLTVDRPSGFRFKRQPRPGCLSTIEAVSLVIHAVDSEPVQSQMHDAFEAEKKSQPRSRILSSVLEELVRIQESYNTGQKPS